MSSVSKISMSLSWRARSPISSPRSIRRSYPARARMANAHISGLFARAVHRVIDVVAGFGEGALQAGRPRVETAHVLAVKAQDGGLVLGAGGEPRRLVLADDPPSFLG